MRAFNLDQEQVKENSMKTDEMDRAIAEHLGWEFIPCHDDGFGRATGETWRDPDGDIGPFPPSYSTDVNAMREAEQILFARYHDAKDIFIDRLCRIMDPVSGYRKQSAVDIIDATAEQHARAFVETIGKWRDA